MLVVASGLLAVAGVLLATGAPLPLSIGPGPAPEPAPGDHADDGSPEAPETSGEQGNGPASNRTASEPEIDDEPDDESSRSLLLVVGDSRLTSAERELRTALEQLGFAVDLVEDHDGAQEVTSQTDVVVISKTVNSDEIADTFLETRSGLVFWEDNAQAIEQGGKVVGEAGEGTRGLGTVDVINPEHTAWHHPQAEVYVNPEAPVELRAGLEGTVQFYRAPEEMTFAPTENGRPLVAPSATWVAAYGPERGGDRYVYYVIEADAGLADGTAAHGRRVYFGLYDDTFPALTAEGRSLFEAAVEWAAASP